MNVTQNFLNHNQIDQLPPIGHNEGSIDKTKYKKFSIADRFAPITAAVDRILAKLPKACNRLWSWLRWQGNPNKPIEFLLEDAIENLGYTGQWIKRCLRRLVNVGLVKIDLHSGRFYKLFLSDPGLAAKDGSPQIEDKNPSIEDKNPQKQPSNPHSAVPSLKGGKEQTDQPAAEKKLDLEEIQRRCAIHAATAPADPDRPQEKALTGDAIITTPTDGMAPHPQEPSLVLAHPDGLLDRAKQAIGTWNPQLQALVAVAASAAIENAIKKIEDKRKKREEIKSPPALFTHLVKNFVSEPEPEPIAPKPAPLNESEAAKLMDGAIVAVRSDDLDFARSRAEMLSQQGFGHFAQQIFDAIDGKVPDRPKRNLIEMAKKGFQEIGAVAINAIGIQQPDRVTTPPLPKPSAIDLPPLDLGDVLAQISLGFSLRGWGAPQQKRFLAKHFNGIELLSRLEDDQVVACLSLLEAGL